MKTGFSKLKNRRGETLIESLVAILAFALSSIVMYSLVTAAAEINYSARQADEDFQAQVAFVEKAEGSGSTKTVTMTLTESPGGSSKSMGSVSVVMYKTDDLTAYYPIPKGGG